MFRIGQRVICIDAAGVEFCGLKKGGVYTVLNIHLFRGTERIIPSDVDLREIGVYSSRFKPFPEADISIFTEMLRKCKTEKEKTNA